MPTSAPPPSAPPPAGTARPQGPAAFDPTFDAAPGEAPPPSLGYRAAGAPPAPGQSADLPPGYRTPEERQAHKRRDRRKRRTMMALGALVFLVGLVATVVITQAANAPKTVADVEVGQCFTGELNDVQTLDCAAPHTGEVFAVAPARAPDDAFPGADALRQEAGTACAFELVGYYGAAIEVATANGVDFQPATPSEAQWDEGNTDTVCVAVPTGASAIEGSIRGLGADAG
jgi:hypothetical protein